MPLLEQKYKDEMCYRSFYRCVFTVVCFALLLGCNQLEQCEVVLQNAKYLDVNTGSFKTGSIFLNQGRVISFDSEQYNAKIKINCADQYVYPGFVDAHCHFKGYATGLTKVDLVGTTSLQDVVNRVLAFAKEHPEVEFIQGRGWDQNDWPNKQFPTNQSLNQAFPDLPVFLTRIDGHAAFANNAALELADSLPLAMPGGLVVRQEGIPTGILIDDAVGLIKVPLPEGTELLQLLQQAEENCLSVGLTGLVDAGLNYDDLTELNQFYANEELLLPLYTMVSDAEEEVSQLVKSGPIISERFKLAAIKAYADGALGSRGALLLQPYADDSLTKGLQLIAYEELKSLCEIAKENGLQVNVHAIGDSANRLVLQVFSEVLETDNNRRWRIEHAQVVNIQDSSYWAEYNIIPSVQPTHATSDMYWAEKRLGASRIADAYSYARLKRWAEGRIALGTDFPVEQIDPLLTFFAAVVRKDQNNYPDGGFLLGQALSRLESIQGMTINAAYSIFQENETGSIDIGKWANFTILDTDLLSCSEEEILSAQVKRTIVHGELLYSAD